MSIKKVLKAFFEATTVKDIASFREAITKERYGMNKEATKGKNEGVVDCFFNGMYDNHFGQNAWDSAR